MGAKFNRRFLDHTEQTCNGEVYKNEDAFNRHGDEVCYISEHGLSDLEEADHEMTDAEIINEGIGDSYNSIVEQCNEVWDDYVVLLLENGSTMDEIGTVADMAEYAFEEVDWQYVSTWISDLFM